MYYMKVWNKKGGDEFNYKEDNIRMKIYVYIFNKLKEGNNLRSKEIRKWPIN